ncbi:hypothetical protein Aduo_003228 [Ancylostoma duodenale]
MQPRDKRGSPCEEEEDEVEKVQRRQANTTDSPPTDRPTPQPAQPHIRLTQSLRSNVDKQSESLRTSLFSGSRREHWQKVSKKVFTGKGAG